MLKRSLISKLVSEFTLSEMGYVPSRAVLSTASHRLLQRLRTTRRYAIQEEPPSARFMVVALSRRSVEHSNNM